MKEKHNIEYSCSCIHEIENKQGFWQPTGNNKDCIKHK